MVDMEFNHAYNAPTLVAALCSRRRRQRRDMLFSILIVIIVFTMTVGVWLAIEEEVAPIQVSGLSHGIGSNVSAALPPLESAPSSSSGGIQPAIPSGITTSGYIPNLSIIHTATPPNVSAPGLHRLDAQPNPEIGPVDLLGHGAFRTAIRVADPSPPSEPLWMNGLKRVSQWGTPGVSYGDAIRDVRLSRAPHALFANPEWPRERDYFHDTVKVWGEVTLHYTGRVTFRPDSVSHPNKGFLEAVDRAMLNSLCYPGVDLEGSTTTVRIGYRCLFIWGSESLVYTGAGPIAPGDGASASAVTAGLKKDAD